MSKIEWCDRSDWNAIRGCTRASEGCRNCYAEAIAARFSDPGQPFHGFAERTTAGPRWTGKVELIEDRLTLPLKWRKPAVIFANSAFDLFHEAVPDAWIDLVVLIIVLAQWHKFLLLTKRSKRMREYFSGAWRERVLALIDRMVDAGDVKPDDAPIMLPEALANLYLGVSAEDQPRADERIPDLLATPAAGRFVSAEPLLGELRLHEIKSEERIYDALRGEHWVPRAEGVRYDLRRWPNSPRLDGVICGGESGPGARPMHPAWARSIRDQCNAAGVAFFMKQWGQWHSDALLYTDMEGRCPPPDMKIGKRRAGRLLDGREHNDLPWRPSP